jgi:hypothetical protein
MRIHHLRSSRSIAVALLIPLTTGVLFFRRPFAQAAGSKVVYVSPNAGDGGDGTRAKPFNNLAMAQSAVRRINKLNNVTVVLGDGTYVISAPLKFAAEDGGQGAHTVTWRAAPGAHPVISSGMRVTDWKIFDQAKNIYVADVPKGVDSRQLFVDGVLADRAAMEIQYRDVTFTADGIIIKNPGLAWLAKVKSPSRMELEATGNFSDRYAPVAAIHETGGEITLTMAQPSWSNNTWGYDVPNDRPNRISHILNTHLYLVNGLELMGRRLEWHRDRDAWYIDPAEGKLYFKPDQDLNIDRMTIMLPRLQALVSIAGSYDNPLRNLTFAGLRFSYTSWLEPSENTGYAAQQSGAYLKELAPTHPPDAWKTCADGCPEFESMRQHWSQIPAAVQVAAARNVTFDHDNFSQIGQIGLGIGNDDDANLSGVGLGTDGVRVTRSRFSVISGAAIMAGGVRKDAHHPSDPRMTNKNLMIDNNFISSVSLDYKDNAGILSTYFDGAQILHNDISDLFYDGIDIGYGWGYNDQGGNPNYRDNQHGYTVNPVFDTPTILRNNLVAYNRIHGVKKWFIDGGSIYNLSSSPGTVIRNNYIFDIGERIGLYVDEGSKHIRLLHNVVDTQGFWLFANTVGKLYALRITSDNRAIGNWHNSDKQAQRWIPESDCLILDDHLVADKDWPAGARKVIAESGIQP